MLAKGVGIALISYFNYYINEMSSKERKTNMCVHVCVHVSVCDFLLPFSTFSGIYFIRLPPFSTTALLSHALIFLSLP